MKLLLLGDFLYDYKNVRDDILRLGEYIKYNNYITILNLEAPLKSKDPIKKWINLFQEESIFKVLKILNVKAVNLANNHIMDWGENGLRKTIERLRDSNIVTFGAGENIIKANEAKIINIEGFKLALMGFGWDKEKCVLASKSLPGVAPMKDLYINKTIESIKNKADYSICYLHWGYEYERYPLPIHRQLAHYIIDQGTDLVIGSHPHVIQSYEIYKNKHIYYSLGNFYMGKWRKAFNIDKYIKQKRFCKYGLGIILDIESLSLNYLFFKSDDDNTRIIHDGHMIDISSIPMDKYNKYFKINRTYKEKPSLYISKHQDLINPIKLCAYEIKYRIKRTIYKALKLILKKAGLYNIVKTFIFNKILKI